MIYIYMYIYTHVCICIYTCIFIFICVYIYMEWDVDYEPPKWYAHPSITNYCWWIFLYANIVTQRMCVWLLWFQSSNNLFAIHVPWHGSDGSKIKGRRMVRFYSLTLQIWLKIWEAPSGNTYMENYGKWPSYSWFPY